MQNNNKIQDQSGNSYNHLLPLVVGGLTITCEDNMILMSRYPDKHFDLAIIDPPYGMEGNKYCTVNKKFVPTGYAVAEIDRGGVTGFSLGNRPNKDYFDELFRVSKNYIIWGGQYFSGLIPPQSLRNSMG